MATIYGIQNGKLTTSKTCNREAVLAAIEADGFAWGVALDGKLQVVNKSRELAENWDNFWGETGRVVKVYAGKKAAQAALAAEEAAYEDACEAAFEARCEAVSERAEANPHAESTALKALKGKVRFDYYPDARGSAARFVGYAAAEAALKALPELPEGWVAGCRQEGEHWIVTFEHAAVDDLRYLRGETGGSFPGLWKRPGGVEESITSGSHFG